MNNITITNPDGKIYYCKNINTNTNNQNSVNTNNQNSVNTNNQNSVNTNNFIYHSYNINIYCGFIKIIILIDLLTDFNIYKYYNYHNYNSYIDLLIDLIAFYSVSTFNRNLFLVYLLKYYFIIILSLNLTFICNSQLAYSYSIINQYNNTNLLSIYNNTNINNINYSISNIDCLYINFTTFTNLIILSIMQRFYYNIIYYEYIYNTILN